MSVLLQTVICDSATPVRFLETDAIAVILDVQSRTGEANGWIKAGWLAEIVLADVGACDGAIIRLNFGRKLIKTENFTVPWVLEFRPVSWVRDCIIRVYKYA